MCTGDPRVSGIMFSRALEIKSPGRNPARRPARFFTAALFVLFMAPAGDVSAQSVRTRAIPNQYYPQQPKGMLRLNYYYDRTGRWVKFSDWIPFQQKKWYPRFLEDLYLLHGLPPNYKPHDIKLRLLILFRARDARFRHPRHALCRIETQPQYHKYRLLMHMKINLIIMRMYMRLGSLYDKRHLYFHDLDFSDDLEISFLIARTYYMESLKYWKRAKALAQEAHEYPFELDLPTIESERYQIVRGELDFNRYIGLHLARVNSKLGITQNFLKKYGKPRPVKKRMQADLLKFYSEDPGPLTPPVLDPEWKEKPLFPEEKK